MSSALLKAFVLFGLASIFGPSLADEDTSPSPATKDGPEQNVDKPWTARAIVPVFGSVLSIKVPPGFMPANEEAHDPVYILELINEHATLSHWSEMITIKGWRGSAVDPKSTPVDLMRYIVGNFQSACRETFAATEPESIEIATVPAIRVIAGCGSVRLPAPPHSELAVIAVFKAGSDFYTVQRAVRGDSADHPPQIDAKALTAKFDQLGPIAICKPGNPADPVSDPCLHPASQR